MHERVAERLREAGWFEGRQVDVAAQLACLAKEGYAPTPSIVAMLQEYSHLTLVAILRSSDMVIDACAAVEKTWRSSVRYWSHRIGKEVIPIGVDGTRHATVVSDEDLTFYVGFGEDLTVFGRFPDAILSRLDAWPAFVPVPKLEGLSEQDFVLDDDP